MPESLKKKTLNSSIWSIIEIISRQGLSFVISIVLARLLSPMDYGTIGIIIIFITISNVFVDSGFSAGLIRKLDKTENDLSTAFWFNIAVSISVYALLFVFAPLISSFFDISELTLLIRALGVVLIINSMNLVHNAILISSMKIKQVSIISVVSQISTGIIAISLAYKGWGVWALITQQIAAALIQCVLLCVFTGWKPKLIFNKSSFKYLWSFGSKLLCANIIGTIFGQAYSFIVGKYIGKCDLGLYSRACHFSQQPSGIVINMITKALVPSLARCQNDLEHLRKNYVKCTEIIGFFIFPLMFSLSFTAHPLFLVLFGEKWIDAIPLFQILCIGYAMDVFSNLSLQLIQVMGRTDYTLKLEIYKKPVYAIVTAISFIGGLKGIVIGQAIYSFIAAMINLSVVKKLLRYSYTRQLMDIFKYACMALCCDCLISLLMTIFALNNLLYLLFFVFFFCIVYLLFSIIFKVKAINYVKLISEV